MKIYSTAFEREIGHCVDIPSNNGDEIKIDVIMPNTIIISNTLLLNRD